MHLRVPFLALVFFGVTSLVAVSMNSDPEKVRQEARKLQADGNFQEALDRYRKLLEMPADDPLLAVDDLDRAFLCLNNLGKQSEVDELLERALQTHSTNWRLFQMAADKMQYVPSYGMIVGQKFTRNPQNQQSGIWVDRQNEDRIRSLRWLDQGLELLQADSKATNQEIAAYYQTLANWLMRHRTDRQAWQLQELTDLSKPVNYADMEAPQGSQIRYASVDESGNPILYSVPASWKESKLDGERLRWVISEATELDESLGNSLLMSWAGLLNSQFSVDTLQESTWLWSRWSQASSTDQDAEKKEGEKTGVFDIHTLEDDETIARLASGIKRFKLPDEHNPIRIYQRLSGKDVKDSVQAQNALAMLANIYANRRQYSKAAAIWRQSIERFRDPGNGKRQQLQNIVDPRGTFDPVPTQLAGNKASLSLLFRNATEASFTAHQVDLELLLADTKTFFKSVSRGRETSFNGKQGWSPPSLQNPSQLFTEQTLGKYASKQVADWKLALTPRENHWDRRIDVETPLTKPGLYVVTVAFNNQKQSTRCLVWIQNTAIDRKPLDNKRYTSSPMPKMVSPWPTSMSSSLVTADRRINNSAALSMRSRALPRRPMPMVNWC